MAKGNGIGLAAFCEHVKRELLTPAETTGEVPLLSVEEVELELDVAVSVEGKGGISVWVLELGADASRDHTQKVKVKLKPLLTAEERRQLYQATNPSGWQRAVEQSLHLLKGKATGTLDQQMGG